MHTTTDVTQYAATPLHISERHILRNILAIVTLARLKYQLPDDGHRPKHAGAF